MAVVGIFSGENEAPIIELFAIISTDQNGNDGILAHGLGGVMMPLVTSKKRVAERMKRLAIEIAKMEGKGNRITLIRLTHREDIEVIIPGTT
jgi:hypothetical protein